MPGGPWDVAVHPGSGTVVVAERLRGGVTVLDGAHNRRVDLPAPVAAVAVVGDSTLAVAAGAFGGLWLIDTAAGAVVDPIPLDGLLSDVCVVDDRAFVTSTLGGLHVVDLRSARIDRRVGLPGPAVAVAATEGHEVAVAGVGFVAIVGDDTVTAVSGIGGGPHRVAGAGSGRWWLTAHHRAEALLVEGGVVVSRHPVSVGPWDVCAAGDTTIVASYTAGVVSVLRAGHLLARADVTAPWAMAPVGNELVVARAHLGDVLRLRVGP